MSTEYRIIAGIAQNKKLSAALKMTDDHKKFLGYADKTIYLSGEISKPAMKRIAKLSPLGFILSLFFMTSPDMRAQTDVNWHDEGRDTVAVERMLTQASELPRAGRVAAIGRMMEETPYVASTLEGSPERVTVNLDGFDCTTFVDNTLALEKTVAEGRSGWRDFIYNLENMRYRGGHCNGYSSRLHYISDWVVENTSRGTLREVTADINGSSYQVKTLDFMTTHRDSYPALKDQSEYERMKGVEMGYRSHRYPVITTSKLNKSNLAALREGDVIALTSKLAGLDVAHMAIITMVDGVPHMLHASTAGGKVLVEPLPLTDYLKRNRQFTGIRVFRMTSTQ